MTGVLRRTWNYERTLIFYHVFLTKTLGAPRVRGIWDRITRRMELCERGIHTGLVGDTEAEGDSREVRASSGGEEDE